MIVKLYTINQKTLEVPDYTDYISRCNLNYPQPYIENDYFIRYDHTQKYSVEMMPIIEINETIGSDTEPYRSYLAVEPELKRILTEVYENKLLDKDLQIEKLNNKITEFVNLPWYKKVWYSLTNKVKL